MAPVGLNGTCSVVWRRQDKIQAVKQGSIGSECLSGEHMIGPVVHYFVCSALLRTLRMIAPAVQKGSDETKWRVELMTVLLANGGVASA
jgi:hypothetical protein